MNLSENDILKINDIVYNAGKAILDIYDTSFEVEIKSDKSPLTQADKKAHTIIESGLESLFPNIPILSDEEHKSIGIEYKKHGQNIILG